jgi:MoaA/NifB/PqqE/SkfB family radical SAM enzyme
MLTLTLEPTNGCNRRCLHCSVSKGDPPTVLPLDLAGSILEQARALGVKEVYLTGGEVATYPHLEALLELIAGLGLSFSLVTNGFRFKERLLPLLSKPEVRAQLLGVCFSLDGARAETHDALRGAGSFAEVMEALALCKLKDLPRALKTVLTRFNQEELTQIALLGALLGPRDHHFITTHPTPRLLQERALPDPEEMVRLAAWVRSSLALTVKGDIRVQGYADPHLSPACCSAFSNLAVNSDGHQILCCQLSHLETGGALPPSPGPELVADLRDLSLKEGVIRQFHQLARLMEARLERLEDQTGLNRFFCYWCLGRFGKLDWLRDFPESPWAAPVFRQSAAGL